MDKNLKPIRITDVFENAELYISEMRQEDGKEILTDLLCQIWAFVESIENDGAKMEALALFVTDHIYRYTAFAKITDKYTYMFFEVLAKELFNAIKKRGVSFFYILDNTIREDRFKLTTQLFGYAGFSVVTPLF